MSWHNYPSEESFSSRDDDDDSFEPRRASARRSSSPSSSRGAHAPRAPQFPRPHTPFARPGGGTVTTAVPQSQGNVAERRSHPPDDPAARANAIASEEDIMRHILPLVANGAAITVIDGDLTRRFVPPVPIPRGATRAQQMSYRAQLQAFLEEVQVHILTSILTELLRQAEPHYDEEPLVGDDLKLLQRRVLDGELMAGFAHSGCDPVCTVCLESFVANTGSVPSRDDPARRRTNESLIITRDKKGVWGTSNRNSHPHHQNNIRSNGTSLSPSSPSDPEEVLEAAEHHGDRIVCRLPCNHFFCYECAKQWFAQTASCPNCRAPLRPLPDTYAHSVTPEWWCAHCHDSDNDDDDLDGNALVCANANRVSYGGGGSGIDAQKVAQTQRVPQQPAGPPPTARSRSPRGAQAPFALYDAMAAAVTPVRSTRASVQQEYDDLFALSDVSTASSTDSRGLTPDSASPYSLYNWDFFPRHPHPPAPPRADANTITIHPNARVPTVEVAPVRVAYAITDDFPLVRSPAVTPSPDWGELLPARSPSPPRSFHDQGPVVADSPTVRARRHRRAQHNPTRYAAGSDSSSANSSRNDGAGRRYRSPGGGDYDVSYGGSNSSVRFFLPRTPSPTAAHARRPAAPRGLSHTVRQTPQPTVAPATTAAASSSLFPHIQLQSRSAGHVAGRVPSTPQRSAATTLATSTATTRTRTRTSAVPQLPALTETARHGGDRRLSQLVVPRATAPHPARHSASRRPSIE